MTVPMVARMNYRRHDTAREAEMAGSMLVPSLIAGGARRGRILDTGGALALQHAVMIPAMLGTMLWRYDVDAHNRHSQ